MAKLREIDLNRVYEEADTGVKVDKINRKLLPTLLLDNQNWVEELAEKNGYDVVTNKAGIRMAKVDYELCDATAEYVLEQVNKQLKKLGVDLEYARVDLVENLAYVAVKKGETTNGFARRILA